MLDGRGSGDEVEGRSVGGGEDTVFGDGSEILEQGMEAVDGKVGGGTLGGSFAARIGRGASGGNGRGSVRRVGMAEFVIEEHGGESLSHVELDVVGEHAEEDVGTDARGQVVIDGADLEVYGFVAAEGAFDLAEAFVDADGLFWAEGMGGHIGADDIEAVEGLFAVNAVCVAGVGEGILGDVAEEVFGHFVLADDLGDTQGDGLLPSQGALVPQGGQADLFQGGFGGL